MNTKKNPWFVTAQPRSSAALRLFCFPFAGGAASVFHDWPKRLPENVEILAVQYPGRETRWGHPPVPDAHQMARAIFEAILEEHDGRPFAFFGHSLGAMMSFEVARLLARNNETEPVYLFLSGRRAPPYAPHPPVLNGLDDAAFVSKMGTLNGTPAQVLENKALMELLLPMLRSDFTLDETYVFHPGEPLHQDVSIYGGEEDFKVPEDHLRAWKDFTTGQATFRLFPGGHFFLKDPLSPFFKVFSVELSRLAGG